MTIDWNAITREVLRRDGPMCGCCQKKPATERHHAIIRRDARFAKVLDTAINISLVCTRCHMEGKCDTPEYRDAHIDRVGREAVRGWVAGLPLKVKPRI
jgi:hypothetical protein